MNPHAGPNQNPEAEAVEPCATRPAKPMSKQSPNRIFCARTAKKRVKTVLVGVPPNTVNLMPRRPESHTGLAITGKGHGIAENILYEAVLE